MKWLIAAAVAVVVASGIASAAFVNASPRAARAPAAASEARLPVAYNGAEGWHGGAVRLPVIYIGESSVFVRTPRWSTWSASSASTRGSLWVNTCTPTCSAGNYHTYPATVSLGRVSEHGGVAYFSWMKLSYRHGHPRTYTYTWGDLPGATMPGWNGGPAS